jgi:uncharacterized protein YjbJ (UPF0337 family)
MHMDEIRGAGKRMMGAIKEAAGRMTHRRDLEAKGAVEKTAGEVQESAGHMEDAAREPFKH